MSRSRQPNLAHETALRNLTDTQQPQGQGPVVEPSRAGGKIVVLNGFPGTGKLTILKHFKKLLPVDTTCLLDNHLLIDPVVAVIPDRSDKHHELRRSVRAPIFTELGNRAKKGHTILMTACLAAGNQRDSDFFYEHLNMAQENHVPIYWLNVQCDSHVLEKRFSTPERQQGSKTKLTDVHILRELLERHELIDPKAICGENSGTCLVFEQLDVSGSLEGTFEEGIQVADAKPLDELDMATRTLQGVFQANYLGKKKWQYILFLTPMAENGESHLLNVDADITTSKLARALELLNIIYVADKDGLFDGEGKKISEINLDQEFARLLEQPWWDTERDQR
ncbi:chloramphenicol phosphotransferase [Fusarium heterosporum]|uniref:Chloramphenicol phosphotransferase n=1 Tax=Fusarium heterosporum TaxID=42747 RepID=A0A8H5WHA3_FUSHE|nr:chloramphenicol phosphotransferase [Fusarium heterosporum]